MSTLYQHRLLIICPAAKQPAVASWIDANISVPGCTACVGSTWPGLNASGLATDPATYYWTSVALVDGHCKAITAKVYQLAGGTPPSSGTWNGWSQAQKIAWLQSVQANIWSSYGVWLELCDNVSVWTDAIAVATAKGLKVIKGP